MVHTADTTDIFYESDTGMFEACVTLKDDDRTTCHVVTVPGHISTPFEFVRPALIRAAKAQRKAGRFYSQVTRGSSSAVRAHEIAFAQPSLLDQLLGRAA